MNTHIIIPIEDITELITKYNKLLCEAAQDRTDRGKSNFIRYGGKVTGLTELLLTKGKKISFNKENIEEKTAIALMNKNYDLNDTYNQAGAGGFASGYKQALKDLI